MKSQGLSRSRRARSGRWPGVERLEGRLCLSTAGLHPLRGHASAELGPVAAGARPLWGAAHGHPLPPRPAGLPRGATPAGAGLGSGSAALSPAPTAAPASVGTAGTSTSNGGNGYVYTRVGDPAAAPPMQGSGGLALEGGGTDIDSVFRWMGSRMGGTGDFLVIRATNDTGYNSYIYDMGGFNSVATLDIPNRAATLNPAVQAIIEKADALFIGGGNQADYINYWEGTPVQQAIADDVSRGVPLGGTSAGTDVIGQFLYSAEGKSVTSSEALDNPFDPSVTLDQDFVNPAVVPSLNNTILDTHFVVRDRMGRMIAFLARIDANGWSANQRPNGIGINEQTALEVTPNGLATVVANASNTQPYVYFLRTPGPAQVVQKNAPLTYYPISVDRVAVGGTFDLGRWQPAAGSKNDDLSYTLVANAGELTSSQPGGSIY